MLYLGFDDDGNVLDSAKFSVLGIFASIFHCVISTSCQCERDFSSLSMLLTNLRRSMAPAKVEKIIFLKMNVKRIPEGRIVLQNLEQMDTDYAKARARATAMQAKGAGSIVSITN